MDQLHPQSSNSVPSTSISAAASSTTAEATPQQPPPPSSASQTPSPIPIPKPLPSPAVAQPSPQLPAPSLSAPPPTRPTGTPAAFSRTWKQHTQFSSPQSPSITASPRGGIAIGVPEAHPGPSPSQPSHLSGGHGVMRPPSIGSASPASTTTQSMQTLNQPWLSAGPQGKPPLPLPSYRPHIGAPSMQQRSHTPQPQHTSSSVPQQQSVASPQSQQSLPLNQHDHFSQQSRVQQPLPLPHQHQFPRPQVPTFQKPSPIAMAQQNKVQADTQTRTTSSESDESGSRILRKRSIHELVSQIDPSEKLEPDVEDILVDIAEDFVDSITTFSCSLAKHRKSDALEAKDILLHLERNWNMALPGFTGDEIKTHKKQLTTDLHKERIAIIKKSLLATEAANARSSAGQSAASMKGDQGKAPANILGSPNFKAREVS